MMFAIIDSKGRCFAGGSCLAWIEGGAKEYYTRRGAMKDIAFYSLDEFGAEIVEVD